MSSIYNLGKEKNLAVYSNGNFIFMRTFVLENTSHAIVLANDFESSLHDVMFNNTIYYLYCNTDGDICLKNIIDSSVLYKLEKNSSLPFYNPHLSILGNSLIFTYIVENPVDDSYCFKCMYPLEDDCHTHTYNLNFNNRPNQNISYFNNSLLFNFYNECSDTCILITPDKKIEPFSPHEKIDFLKNTLEKKDALIESIKKQYLELYDTASKYREEAIKWRNKFFS